MRKLALAVVALTTTALMTVSACAQPTPPVGVPNAVRKVLEQHDIDPNSTMTASAVTIPAGGREGRHTHTGPLILYVVSGAFSLDHEGKPNTTYKAGETAFVEAGKQHEGINKGTVDAFGIGFFITPKGAPLTTQVESNGK